jgi:glycosyltransferase involved in cell wall biosynthesis
MRGAQREKMILKSCKYFMGRTDWDKRLSAVLSPNSRYFLCNEVMRSGFYQNRWHEPENQNEYIITSTIRNNIYKGLETIFASKKLLKQHFPEFNITWRIAGINMKDEITFLTERKLDARLEDYNIKLLGSLNEDGLIKEMMNANLFVHASHIDNSPNSVCEAMLLGMPVIASYVGGTPSIISDKIEGLLVQDGDPYALAGAIIELIRDRDLAKNLGIKAREKAIVRHDPKLILKDLRHVYASVISVD